MNLIINCPCPYCGKVNRVRERDISYTSGRGITTCDSEHGGCDKDFAYGWTLTPTIKTSPLNFSEEDDG